MQVENTSGGDAAVEVPSNDKADVSDTSIQYESTTNQPEPKPDTPAKVVEEPAEPHEDDEEEPENGEPKPRKKQTGYLKKLGRAEAERDAERAKASELQKELEALKAPKQPETESELVEPDPSQFNTYGEYQNALRQYDKQALIKEQAKLVEDALAKDKEASKKAAESQAFESQMNKSFEEFDAKLTEYEATAPGTRDKIESLVNAGKVSDPVLYLVLNSPDSMALATHLANNSSALEAMNKMSPPQLIREIGRLEGKLTNGSQPSEGVRHTKASAPITPVKAQAGSSSKNPIDMPQEEYERWLYSDRRR